MLLTITTTHQPATDLGFLLHKHPARAQTFSLNFGQAHIFYPEATEERCTAALLLDIDPVHLVRGREKLIVLEQYVNDRPYVASSFLSVAISAVFGTALNGHCKARPELAESKLPLQARLEAVPSPGGAIWLQRLFEPLGYTVTITPHLLDEQFTDWGESKYYTLTLEATCRLSDLLSHIYVLIPVLDNEKHYWFGDDEVEKLLAHGQGWLEQHPEKTQITERYLKYRKNLVQSALTRLVVADVLEEEDDENIEAAVEAEAVAKEAAAQDEKPYISVHNQRLQAVMEVLKQREVTSVLDLGCGEGKLIRLLLKEPTIMRILGMDVSYRTIEQAKRHMERLAPKQRERLTLIHGSLTYRDQRLEGYDAAAIVEVIEHLDEARLAAFARALFECAHPTTVVITTPNADYNVKFPTLEPGHFRHHDHRFEWTRQQFHVWSTEVAESYGYTVRIQGVGPEDTEVGALSQMAVFTR